MGTFGWNVLRYLLPRNKNIEILGTYLTNPLYHKNDFVYMTFEIVPTRNKIKGMGDVSSSVRNNWEKHVPDTLQDRERIDDKVIPGLLSA